MMKKSIQMTVAFMILTPMMANAYEICVPNYVGDVYDALVYQTYVTAGTGAVELAIMTGIAAKNYYTQESLNSTDKLAIILPFKVWTALCALLFIRAAVPGIKEFCLNIVGLHIVGLAHFKDRYTFQLMFTMLYGVGTAVIMTPPILAGAITRYAENHIYNTLSK